MKQAPFGGSSTACTRARDHLLISGVKVESQFPNSWMISVEIWMWEPERDCSGTACYIQAALRAGRSVTIRLVRRATALGAGSSWSLR